jgi:hypothetical protein
MVHHWLLGNVLHSWNLSAADEHVRGTVQIADESLTNSRRACTGRHTAASNSLRVTHSIPAWFASYCYFL